jgi:hypothetical protein
MAGTGAETGKHLKISLTLKKDNPVKEKAVKTHWRRLLKCQEISRIMLFFNSFI